MTQLNPTTSPSTDSVKKKILIVEDEKSLRDLIVRRAEKIYHWECRVDETGEKCISLCHEFQPDVILLDMGLPKTSGLSLLRMIKSDPVVSLRKIPVIVFSAYSYSELVSESLDLGAQAYYTKSEPLSVLFSHIQHCLRQEELQ
jgi:CheY-like chemotaxis protein